MKRKYKYKPFKQGKYRPVNKEKYIGKHIPEYRSSWELRFFEFCDKNPLILEWSSESVIVPYISPVDGKLHRYYVDGAVVIREGNNIVKYLIEIKPEKQTIPPKESKRKKASTLLYEKVTYAINQAKWEAASKFASQKGMKFIILTEKELFSNK